jgi:hypothetical protein
LHVGIVRRAGSMLTEFPASSREGSFVSRIRDFHIKGLGKGSRALTVRQKQNPPLLAKSARLAAGSHFYSVSIAPPALRGSFGDGPNSGGMASSTTGGRPPPAVSASARVTQLLPIAV